mgnify:CR=1 FL=1
MNLEKEIFDISLQDIIPNRFQPREMFDDEALKELSQSIKEHGVIQPIIVRKVGDKYEIIAGERRFRASQLAGKQTIPALVRDIDDKEAAKIALLENLQRSNLTPIEEAKTYQTILKLDNITQEELAQNLGKSQSTIANKLRLLTLDEEVQTALLNSQISERHARSLIGLDLEKQRELLHKIINEKLTVKGLDEEIMKMTGKLPEQETPQVQQQEIIPPVNTPTFAEQTINPQPNNTPVINQPTEIPQENINESINENINNPQVTTEIPNQIEQPIITPQESQNTEPIKEANQEQQVENQTPIINNPNTQEVPTPQPEHKENIFDKLRVQEPEIPIINSETQTTPNQNFNNIYDLRFAINNFRQAIQNTEKFGFKVKADEYDSPNKYQIVIEIEKNN